MAALDSLIGRAILQENRVPLFLIARQAGDGRGSQPEQSICRTHKQINAVERRNTWI
jgi:hypothetical protein